jgi:hypothetical protein
LQNRRLFYADEAEAFMQVTRSEGFSLVEVLVAAFIVALSIISVAAFIRKGNDMIALDKHRREARAAVERTIENPLYQRANYPNLFQNTLSQTIPIDPDFATFQGTLTVTIGNELTDVGINAGANKPPYRTITVSVTWNEPGATAQEVVSSQIRVSP